MIRKQDKIIPNHMYDAFCPRPNFYSFTLISDLMFPVYFCPLISQVDCYVVTLTHTVSK